MITSSMHHGIRNGNPTKSAALLFGVLLLVAPLGAAGCSTEAPAQEEEQASTESNLSSGGCQSGFAACVRGGGGRSCASKWCSGACVSEVASCVGGGGGASCSSRCTGTTGPVNTAPAEACVGAVLATAAWCRTPLTCAATLAAVCGACVNQGCVGQALEQMACDPGKGGRYSVVGPYPDGSCCQVCANGKIDVCDPNLCPAPQRPSCNNPDAYGNCD